MNRHTSNPFLSDWDDDSVPVHTQTNAHLFDSSPAQVLLNVATNETSSGNNPARRSSCSQAEFGSAPASERGVRPSLYRRNMSSFEAASLQLEQHQQQMLENGSHQSLVDAHRDLIAKMTADFQSAIQTNDKQFENLSFNPFDPFETIVDDDGLNSPAPTSLTESGRGQNKFDLGADGEEMATGNFDDGGRKIEQASASHDSIDDDDEELVSTPVRNIKSHADLGGQRPGLGENGERGPGGEASEASSGPVADLTTIEPDSIKKASMFASLLASAESSNQHDASGGIGSLGQMSNEGVDGFSSSYGHDQDVEATTHVIKGSPNSMGGDVNDRSVSFFDPFETVIDKDALTSLVSDNHNQSTNNGLDDAYQTLATSRGNELSPGPMLQHQRVAESASIETVIENQSADDEGISSNNKNSNNNADGKHSESVPAYLSPASQEAIDSQLQDETTSNAEDSAAATAAAANNETALRAMTTTTASSASDLHYDSSTALERPQGRRLAPQSGIAPPQPTPSKRSTTRPQRRKASSFQEDSSDSSEEDDRIQIVIKARDVGKPDESGSVASGSSAIVPLLPPPPSKSSIRQARERGQVEDMPSPIMSYKKRQQRRQSDNSDSGDDDRVVASATATDATDKAVQHKKGKAKPLTKVDDDEPETEEGDDEGGGADDDDDDDDDDDGDDGGQFVIKMTRSDGEGDDGDTYGKCETPLYDEDTSYVLEDYPHKYDGPGWEMMLRYPPKKKLTSNRFWKKIFVKLAQVPLAPLDKTASKSAHDSNSHASQNEPATGATCWALQIFDQQDDKKPMQEIPIQATYTVSEISSQLFDQFGKIFTIKLQYIFYKERVGVRQGQLARFIHTGHIGSSTTSGGHGVDPISIGAIKRMGAPIEHSPQISQIIKLGCCNYEDIKQFKECLEDCLFRMPIHRDRALTSYKTEEVQMAVRDEIYIELNQIGTILKQLARVRLFFLSFLNGTPVVEVGINDHHRQGREVVGRMDILPVVTEEWIRLEAWELHTTVDVAEFEDPNSRIVKLTPPDATFFELMRFRVRPPRNRELPLQISANMSVTRTRISINCEVMVPGCVSRKHGQIPCENIAIRIHIPECWVYFFREEKHFRMGSKKSVNRRPGKVKGIERFLGGGGLQNDFNDESSLIEVTSGQAKYEHHHHAIVWRAARWPKESQSAYVQNTMKIRLPLTAYDKMPEQFYEFVHVEYTMPATTVSHTTLRSISVNPYEEEPPEKYVKYAAKYEYKVKMRLSVNLGARSEAAGAGDGAPEVSPIVIMKQPDLQDDLQREEDIDDDDDDDDDDEGGNGGANHHYHADH